MAKVFVCLFVGQTKMRAGKEEDRGVLVLRTANLCAHKSGAQAYQAMLIEML